MCCHHRGPWHLTLGSVGKSVSCRQTPGYNHLSRCVSKEIMKGVYSQTKYEEQSLRSAAKNHKAGCYVARTAKQQWWPGDQWVSLFLCSVIPSWQTWKLASSLGGTKGNCAHQVLTSHSLKLKTRTWNHTGFPEGRDLFTAVSDAGHREDHTAHSLRVCFFLPPWKQDSRDQQRTREAVPREGTVTPSFTWRDIQLTPFQLCFCQLKRGVLSAVS